MAILPGRRTYGRKTYTLHDKRSTKAAANKSAARSRKAGYNARVGPKVGCGRDAEYGVYRRRS